MIIYLFDKNLQLTTALRSMTSAMMKRRIGGAERLTFEVPVAYAAPVNSCSYAGHFYEGRFYIYTKKYFKAVNSSMVFDGISYAYDELAGIKVIEDKRPQNCSAQVAINAAIEDTGWETGTVETTAVQSTNFYYVTPLQAIQKVVEVWQIEPILYFDFDGKQITGRKIDILQRRGANTGARYVYGSNLLDIVYEEKREGIATALIGRGKGEEIKDEAGNPTGEYGRRVGFEDVVWTTPGDPVSKPAGQDYLEIPTMTALYGYPKSNGTMTPRFDVFIVDSETEPEAIIAKTYDELVERCRPRLTLSATVAKAGAYQLGDTNYIIRPDLGFYYEARVFEDEINLLAPALTRFKFGDYVPSGQAKRIRELKAQFDGVNDKISAAEQSIKGQIIKLSTDWYDALMAAQETQFFSEASYNYTLGPENDYGLPAGVYSFNAPLDDDPLTPEPTGFSVMRAGMIGRGNLVDGVWDFTMISNASGLNADNINAGTVKAQFVELGSSSTFATGYDPSDKADAADVYTITEVDTKFSVMDGEVTTKISTAINNVTPTIEAVADDLYDFTTAVNTALADLQDQVDGSITSWFYEVAPTTSNAPAVDWTTTELKNLHLGDLYYDTVTGYSYRWQISNNVHGWVMTTDTDVAKALSDAAAAQDTADSKRRVFTATPTTPYEIGDLWAQGSTGELMRCKTTQLTGSYSAAHWELASKYTDDATAIANLATAKTYAETKASEAQAAAIASANAKAEAERVIAEAYADGIVDAEEVARIDDVNAKAAAAATDASTKAAAAEAAAKTYADTKEAAIIKQTTAPAHLAGRLWLDTSVTPNILKRSTGTAWVNATPTTAAEVGAESAIYKQNTAPAHLAGRLWLDTNTTPNILKRSTGSAWVNATPTTAGEVGAEGTVYKQNTAPAHLAGRLWIDTSVTPNTLKRSTGTAWVNASYTSDDIVAVVRNNANYTADLAAAAASRDTKLLKALMEPVKAGHADLISRMTDLPTDDTILNTAASEELTAYNILQTTFDTVIGNGVIDTEEWTSFDDALAAYQIKESALATAISKATFKITGVLQTRVTEAEEKITADSIINTITSSEVWETTLAGKLNATDLAAGVDNILVEKSYVSKSTVDGQIDTLTSSITSAGESIKDLQTTFIKDINGLSIASGLGSTMQLGSSSIRFLMAGQDTYSWDKGVFYTKDVQVTGSIQIGNHKIEKNGTEGTIFVPMGGM